MSLLDDRGNSEFPICRAWAESATLPGVDTGTVCAITMRLADAEMDETALMDALRTGMDRHVPDAATRALWLGRFGRIAGEFAEQEAMRRADGRPAAIEEFARWRVPGTGFTLRARADRIDLRGDGVAIYDYKTGAVPSIRQQDAYAKQLMLEALMVEDGAFGTLGRRPVRSVGYLGIGGKLSVTERAVDDALRGEVMAGLVALIGRYSGDAPFPARLAYEHLGYSGDYDHLARHGEWDDTCAFTPQAVG